MEVVNLTRQEILDYLGIDYEDERTIRILNRTLKTADLFLKGSIGIDYPKNDERAKEIALIVIDELYSNRGISEKVSGNTRRLIEDFSLQLKMELKRKNESERLGDCENE